MTQEQEIVKAIVAAKKSQFGLTGIKVELEAQLDRRSRSGGGCHECGGSHYRECSYCDGGGDTYCRECDEDGSWECGDCYGDGTITNDHDEEVECSLCEGDGRVSCEDCDGTGRVDCYECEGRGRTECEYCDEPDEDAQAWGDDFYCEQWILRNLEQYGLSEKVNNEWKPKLPLVFAKFYYDGSVDSELTFTLSMNKSKNVLLIPKVVQAFKDMADEMGASLDVDGAGMHMALLNTKNCYYHKSSSFTERPNDKERYKNYRKSMMLLMPALYFLGSSSDTTRGLNYRKPGVGSAMYRDGHGKYSAVNWTHGALEFRIFETCYDNPLISLDNVIVMCKTLKYWKRRYQRNYLSNVTKRVKFGVDNNRKLERFYVLTEHVDLLNRGLKLIKPDYVTVSRLKKQRNFTINKTELQRRDKALHDDAVISYKEYEERFEIQIEITRKQAEAQYLYDLDSRTRDATTVNLAAEMERAKVEAERRVEMHKREKRSLTQFVQQRLEQAKNNVGGYTLEEA